MTINEHTPFRVAWSTSDASSLVYHGDSRRLMESMPENSVDCIWTDPPYFLSNDGMTCVAGQRVSVNKGEWDRSGGVEEDHAFNLSWLAECHRILKPSGTIWVHGDFAYLPECGHGDDAVGVPHPERHHLGEDESPTQSWLPVFRPFYGDDPVGNEGAQGKQGEAHVQLQGHEGREWRQADEERVALSVCWAGRESSREASNPKAGRAYRKVPKGQHEPGGLGV